MENNLTKISQTGKKSIKKQKLVASAQITLHGLILFYGLTVTFQAGKWNAFK